MAKRVVEYDPDLELTVEQAVDFGILHGNAIVIKQRMRRDLEHERAIPPVVRINANRARVFRAGDLVEWAKGWVAYKPRDREAYNMMSTPAVLYTKGSLPSAEMWAAASDVTSTAAKFGAIVDFLSYCSDFGVDLARFDKDTGGVRAVTGKDIMAMMLRWQGISTGAPKGLVLAEPPEKERSEADALATFLSKIKEGKREDVLEP